MSLFLIATTEELRLLTKKERDVYEMFRLEGKTKDVICKALHISLETFRSHWARALKKIRQHRDMVENPQWLMSRGRKGRDVLSSSKELTMQHTAPAQSLALMRKDAPVASQEQPKEEEPETQEEEPFDPQAIFDKAERDLGITR